MAKTEAGRPFARWSPELKRVVGVIVFVLAALLLYAARGVLAPIIIGIIIGYIFYPYARFIQYSTAIPHRPATGLLYLILLAILIPIVALTVPLISDQINFFIDEGVLLAEQLSNLGPEETFEVLGLRFSSQAVVTEVSEALITVLQNQADNAVTIIVDVAQAALLVVITLLIGFYMTSDGDRFLAAIENAIPDSSRGDIEEIVTRIDEIWATFFRANLLLAVVVGVLMTGVSALIGLPRPALMGGLAGLLEFIPTVGHIIWLLVAVTVGGIEGAPAWMGVSNVAYMLIIIGVTIVYTQLDTRVLIPAIIGDRDRLHPAVVVIGIIIGAAVAGVLGIVLAAPTISSLAVIGGYIRAKLTGEEPFPKAAPPTPPERQLEEPESDSNGNE